MRLVCCPLIEFVFRSRCEMTAFWTTLQAYDFRREPEQQKVPEALANKYGLTSDRLCALERVRLPGPAYASRSKEEIVFKNVMNRVDWIGAPRVT